MKPFGVSLFRPAGPGLPEHGVSPDQDTLPHNGTFLKITGAVIPASPVFRFRDAIKQPPVT